MDGIKAVCDIFDIPYDVAGNIPRVTVLGDSDIYVENFVSLEEYKKETVKLKCKNGVIALFGKDFYVKAVRESCILVCGRVEEIKFI